MKRILRRKSVYIGLAAGLILALGGTAFAYFTSTGSGTGSAKTGNATRTLTISQIGAGYDSLIPNNTYQQDQCFECVSITEFGNDITLANPGAQELVNVVVAMRNWGGAITDLPMTLSISSGVGGPISDTQDFSFPAAIASGVDPSTTNITFDFSSQGAFVEQEFYYGITFDPTFDDNAASSLNVALSSSALNLSVGTDTDPGTVYVDSPGNTGLENDAPSCLPLPGAGVFGPVITDCATQASGNPGAYGTPDEVAAGNADIPAVEVNVVGGVTPSLYPGGPAQPISYAVTNPNSATVHLDTITTSIASVTSGTIPSPVEACSTSMYQINNPTATANEDLPPGTTFFLATGTSIQMLNDGNNQDNCEGSNGGGVVTLDFSSN